MASSEQCDSSFLTFLLAKKVVSFTKSALENYYINEYCKVLEIINTANTALNFQSFKTVLKCLLHSGHVSQSADKPNIITINKLSASSKINNSDDFRGIQFIGEINFKCNLCGTKETNLGCLKNHVGGRKHKIQILIMALNSKRDQLISNKKDVEITSDHDNDEQNGYIKFDMKPKENDTCILYIKNLSKTETVSLKCYRLLKNLPKGIVSLNDRREYSIAPEGTQKIKMVVKTVHIGKYEVPLAFTFENELEKFHIIRFICINSKNEIIDDLQPIAPYKKSQKDCSLWQKNCETFNGRPPPNSTQNSLVLEIPIKKYAVPMHLQKGLKETPSMKHTDRMNVRQNLEDLESQLTMANYDIKFHLLLYLEDVQQEIDIKAYDMDSVSLTKCTQNRNPLLSITVPGLMENRPSVLKGDHLLLQEIASNGPSEKKQYKAYVHKVNLTDLSLDVHKQLIEQFVDNMKFRVRFTVNRFPLRMQHRAVDFVIKHGLESIVFPTSSSVATRGLIQPLEAIKLFYNRDLEKNPEQLRAVRHIVSGSARPAPYIVFGPPGTGKTSTIVEAIKQIVKHLPGSHILVCAASNSAVDLLTQRLLAHLSKSSLFRLYASSRSWDCVPEDIRNHCNMDKDSKNVYFPSCETLMQYKVLLCTLLTAGRLVSANFPPGHFSHIVIDEAGQAVEPECLIPIAGIIEPELKFPDGGVIVLAGDPEQLEPIIRSPHAQLGKLGLSFLERLMHHCEVYARHDVSNYNVEDKYDSRILTKLVQNYRSHPDILCVPNELFYNGELQPCADKLVRESLCQWEHLPCKGFPLIFHGVSGEDAQEANSPSFFNLQEISVVMDYVEKLLDTRGIPIKKTDIGIIAPYRKQVEKLRLALNKKKWTEIKVGSVEEFQGQERRIIIVTTVRSNAKFVDQDKNYNLGFVANYKRFNVAVTRAKALLIVAGNAKILMKDKNWKRLIKFCKDNGGCTGDYNVPDDDVDEDNNCNAESKPEGSVSNNGNNSDAEDDDDNALLRRLQSLGLDASSTSADDEGAVSMIESIMQPEWDTSNRL